MQAIYLEKINFYKGQKYATLYLVCLQYFICTSVKIEGVGLFGLKGISFYVYVSDYVLSFFIGAVPRGFFCSKVQSDDYSFILKSIPFYVLYILLFIGILEASFQC